MEEIENKKEFNFWKDNTSPTRNLLITNTLVYIVTTGFSLANKSIFTTSWDVLFYVGENNFRVLHGHVYLLVTAIFVHASVLHFFSNMLFLLIYGLRAEERLYPLEYYIIFFTSALLGNLLSLAVFPVYSISCGASGGIFGLLGVDLILGYEEKKSSRSIWGYLATGLIFLLLSVGVNVNFAAHAVGLVAGVSLPFLLKRRKAMAKVPDEQEMLLDS